MATGRMATGRMACDLRGVGLSVSLLELAALQTSLPPENDRSLLLKSRYWNTSRDDSRRNRGKPSIYGGPVNKGRHALAGVVAAFGYHRSA
jgi:hypothetical protein